MTTALLDVDNRTAFSVAVFYSDNLFTYPVRFVDVERAFRSFIAAIAAAQVGNGITRVIVTDGGNCIAAEWKVYKGYSYPSEIMQWQA